jgi:hypothetical protein
MDGIFHRLKFEPETENRAKNAVLQRARNDCTLKGITGKNKLKSFESWINPHKR